MAVWKRFKSDKLGMFCLIVLTFIFLVGIFSRQLAPNDPTAIDVANKYAGFHLSIL